MASVTVFLSYDIYPCWGLLQPSQLTVWLKFHLPCGHAEKQEACLWIFCVAHALKCSGSVCRDVPARRLGSKITISSVLSRDKVKVLIRQWRWVTLLAIAVAWSLVPGLKGGSRNADGLKLLCAAYLQTAHPSPSVLGHLQAYAQEAHGCLILTADSVLWMPSETREWLSSRESFLDLPWKPEKDVHLHLRMNDLNKNYCIV